MVLIRVLANLLILQLSYAQKSSELVIGGNECNINEHRFLVALYDNLTGTLDCGGTLINQEWVLSAAHCDRTSMVIYLGMHNKSVNNDDQQRRSPKEKYFFNCSNSFTQLEKDIMLIRLDSPVNNSTHIAPLSLPSSPPSMDSVCRVMGWGAITSPKGRDLCLYSQTQLLMQHQLDLGSHYVTREYWNVDEQWDSLKTFPEVPRCANINLFDYTVCRGAFSRLPETRRILCAGVMEGGIDTCNHDSGGPLICDGQFQGIVSWGPYPCAQPRKPALYTNVFNYNGWIQSIIAGNIDAACPP